MFSSAMQELKLLFHICFAQNHGVLHRDRMENYFKPQAERYDSFRDRLLHGRRELFSEIEVNAGDVWIDIGGGTGRSLEFIDEKINKLSKVYIVDISPSLLAIAKERIKKNNWKNVYCIEADAASFCLSDVERADVVTFTYSLSMIPNWFEALDSAYKLLKPNAQLAVIDFYIAKKHPNKNNYPRQSFLARLFWQIFFVGDDVFPNGDHLAYLSKLCSESSFKAGKGKIPYLPLWAPYYQFIGRRKNKGIE
ncbi:MAG: methyltransferase [Bdellovibrionales bacterium]|nr:methyltransferase [Bdellovibrionales bacterium]